MPRTIAINGTRLDKVRMPAEPFSKGVILSLSYPTSQIRYSLDEGTLRLVLPAYLSVELYRIGILPQDVNIPVRISIGGRPVGRYIVSDVRYPTQNDSPFGQVTFTLTRVLQRNARSTGEQPLSQPAAAVSTKYVTDITHYLDETGELAQLPGPARRLASFLTLLIEAATGAPSAGEHDSGIRCMVKACRGTIRTSLPPGQDEIYWRCQACGHNGVIRSWNNTKWNQLKRIEETGAC
ncbi:MAG: hypothetical protein WBC80_28770 [Isosphaeraceae bacterium]|jgi:hypothetical protein